MRYRWHQLARPIARPRPRTGRTRPACVGSSPATGQAGAVTDSPARREAAERERRQREAEDLIRNDPLVQEMLAQFPSARIVPGSIKPH